MMKYKYRFCASKSKLFLAIMVSVVFTFLLAGGIIASVFNLSILFVPLLSLIILVGLGYLSWNMVYIIEVYDDKLVFKSLFHKKKEVLISQIGRISIYELSRENKQYFLEVNWRDNFLSYNYPYKFDINKKTEHIVNEFWHGTVSVVNLNGK